MFSLKIIVLLDGAIWIALTLLSALALFDRINSPWILIVLWFTLHPMIMLASLFVKFSLYYPRYRWSMKNWITTTTFLWAYQSLFFVYHIVIHGFFQDLSIADGASAIIAAGISVDVWQDAFWAEMLQPYSFKKLSEITE